MSGHSLRDKYKLPPVALNLHEKSSKAIFELFSQVLDKADDTLFQLSSNAQSDDDREWYFSAMREVRIKREGIEKRFQEEYKNAFFTLATRDAFAEKYLKKNEESAFSIVENDNLEEKIAIETMIAKSMRKFDHLVDKITAALDQSIEHSRLTNKENPLSPYVIGECLFDASKVLNLDMRSKILVFRLFESDLFGNLDQALRPCLQMLEDQNLVSEDEPEPSVTSEPERDSEKTLESMVSNIHDYLNESRKQTATMQSGPELSNVDVQDMLAEFQKLDDAVNPEKTGTVEHTGSMPMPQLIDARALLQQRIAALDGAEAGKHIGHLSENTINLVALLFEFILEDDSLANSVKAALLKLQIPVLRLGLIDQNFFSQRKHPARLLLNQLAKTGVGVNEGDLEDPNLTKINQAVQKILDEFNNDPALFKTVYEEYSAYVHHQEEVIEEAESELSQSEEDSEIVARAAHEIGEQFSEKLADKELPKQLVKLITEVWPKTIANEYLDQEDPTTLLNPTLEFINTLVWSIEDKPSKAERNELVKKIPEIINALKAGFKKVELPSHEVNSHLESLKMIHLQVIREGSYQESATAEAQEYLEGSIAANNDHNTEFSADNSRLTLEEATQMATNLKAGCWLEYTIDGTPTRCKLALYLAFQNKYVFVNAKGQKILEKQQDELIKDFQVNAIHIIDNHELFDRALQSVIENLREQENTEVPDVTGTDFL